MTKFNGEAFHGEPANGFRSVAAEVSGNSLACRRRNAGTDLVAASLSLGPRPAFPAYFRLAFGEWLKLRGWSFPVCWEGRMGSADSDDDDNGATNPNPRVQVPGHDRTSTFVGLSLSRFARRPSWPR